MKKIWCSWWWRRGTAIVKISAKIVTQSISMLEIFNVEYVEEFKCNPIILVQFH